VGLGENMEASFFIQIPQIDAKKVDYSLYYGRIPFLLKREEKSSQF